MGSMDAPEGVGPLAETPRLVPFKAMLGDTLSLHRSCFSKQSPSSVALRGFEPRA